MRFPSDTTAEAWSRVSPVIPAAKRGLSAEHISVIVARERHGTTTDAVLPKLNRVSIAAMLDGIVTPNNEFCCDGGTAIVAFARPALPYILTHHRHGGRTPAIHETRCWFRQRRGWQAFQAV